MRFSSTICLTTAGLAAVCAAAPLAPVDGANIKRNNPKFDWPGASDEALDKRNNPKFDWPGASDEALDKRNNPKFDSPGAPDEA